MKTKIIFALILIISSRVFAASQDIQIRFVNNTNYDGHVAVMQDIFHGIDGPAIKANGGTATMVYKASPPTPPFYPIFAFHVNNSFYFNCIADSSHGNEGFPIALDSTYYTNDVIQITYQSLTGTGWGGSLSCRCIGSACSISP